MAPEPFRRRSAPIGGWGLTAQLSKAARLGIVSSPEALFVLVAQFLSGFNTSDPSAGERWGLSYGDLIPAGLGA